MSYLSSGLRYDGSLFTGRTRRPAGSPSVSCRRIRNFCRGQGVRKIVADIAALKCYPNLLRPLADKIERQTDFLYYLCGRYSIAISLVEAETISIVRILDGRSDYVTEVFGSEMGN